MSLQSYTRTFRTGSAEEIAARPAWFTPLSAMRSGSSSGRHKTWLSGGSLAKAAGVATPAIAPAASEAMKKAIEHYQPGGGYGAGVEAGLERGRVRSLASGMQSLVSSGLAGTTMAAGLGTKYEEEVAAPTRAGVEETRAQALSGLEMVKAQIIQGATESARASALQKYIAQLQSGTSAGISGPPSSDDTQQKAIDQANYNAARKTAQERHQMLYGATSNFRGANFGKDFSVGGEETTQTVSSGQKEPQPMPFGLTPQQQTDWREHGAYMGKETWR